MTNVLPEDSLRAVRRFYAVRLVFVGSIVLIVCGGIAFVALLPAYAAVSSKYWSENGQPEVEFPETSSDRQSIVHAQSLVRELKPLATSTLPIAELLDEVLKARGPRIRVDAASIRRGSDGSIAVSGTMSSRDDLNAYRTALAENPRFEKVSVPLGILAGASDTSFALTISGPF